MCLGVAPQRIQFLGYTREFDHDFYICDDSTMPLLGMDFMSEHDTYLCLTKNLFKIDDVKITPFDATGTILG